MKRLVFENRAWREAEHPRYVSEPLKVSEDRELVFEIFYHYVEEKYYVEELELGEREAAVMLGRELKVQTQTTARQKSLDPPALEAYAGLLGKRTPDGLGHGGVRQTRK